MSDTLIIYEKNNAVISAGFDEHTLVSFKIDEKENVYKPGNVFVGHVSKILLHLKAAYVDIGMDHDCYMEMEDDFDYLTADSHPDGELHVGDELVVQIKKEAGKGKPATVSPGIEIAGKLVLVSYNGKFSKIPRKPAFSSKIKDPDFKKNVEKLFSAKIMPKRSLLIRTGAYEADSDAILKDYESCLGMLENILETGCTRTKGSLLWESPPNYLTQIRDHKGFDCDKLITDSPDIYVRLKDYLNEYHYDMKKNIKDICSEKIWLKSGASIVIQQTEALSIVDVNSSKASGDRKNFKEGFLKLNLEAAGEICRQLILRNLSGIIVVDFINDKNTSQNVFLAELEKIFSVDKTIQVVDITKLGLVEITRKRESKPVTELIKKYKL